MAAPHNIRNPYLPDRIREIEDMPMAETKLAKLLRNDLNKLCSGAQSM
jgi:hypothetical protein